MTATAFLIVDLVTGRRLGGAVVAPEARYCSRLLAGAERLDRRFVPAPAWPKVERELAELHSGPPVDSDSAVSVAVLGDRRTHSQALQRLHATPVAGEPGEVASKLDQLVRSLLPPVLSMRQSPND